MKTLFTSFTLFLLLVQLSLSQVTLSPGKQELDVHPGRMTTFQTHMMNRESEPAHVRVFMQDLDITEDGSPFPADSSFERGFTDWVTLEPSEFTLDPFQSQYVTGTINVPRDAEGSYYCFFKMDLGQQRDKQGVNTEGEFVIGSQAATFVFITTRGRNVKSIITSDTLLIYPYGKNTNVQNINVFNDNPWEVIIPIHNDGNTHSVLQGNISVWSASGVRIGQEQLQAGGGYVLPGRTRNFKATGNGPLRDGNYLLTLNLHRNDGHSINDRMPFSIVDGEVNQYDSNDDIDNIINSSVQRFSFSKPFTDRKFVPGQNLIMPINIHNLSTDTLTLEPMLLEWSIDRLGNLVFATNKKISDRSANLWIMNDLHDVILSPKQASTYKLSYSIPDDTLKGNYYSAIAFIPADRDSAIVYNFLSTRTYMILFESSIPGVSKIDVSNISIHSLPDEQQGCEIKMEVNNIGEKHCYIEGKISIEEEIDPEIYQPLGSDDSFGGKDELILPNTTRAFAVNVSNITSGNYRMLLTISYDSDEENYFEVKKFTL